MECNDLGIYCDQAEPLELRIAALEQLCRDMYKHLCCEYGHDEHDGNSSWYDAMEQLGLLKGGEDGN